LDIQNKEASYAIPLKLDKPLAEFFIRIEAQQIVTKPQVKFGHPLKIQSIEGGFVIEEKMKEVQLNEYLVMMVPDFPPNLIMEGEDVRDHVHYFVVSEVPEVPENKEKKSASSSKVGIIWDSSLSRRGSHANELEIVEKLLSQMPSDVDIYLLRHFTSKPVHFASGNHSTALEFLKAVTYDGGTNMESVDLGNTNYDFVMAFTDGLSNVGEDLPTRLPNCPMFIFSNSVQINDLPLRFAAAKTGGQYFDLLKSTNLDKIVSSIKDRNTFGFVTATFDSKEITDFLPSQPQTLLEGEKFSFSGKLLAKKAVVEIHYGFNGKASFSKKITVSQKSAQLTKGAPLSNVVPRLWAQQKVGELSIFPEQNKEKLIDLGRKYGFVTSGASLLVLSTVEQYLKHGIEPSADGLPEVLKAFKAKKAEEKKAEESRVSSKLSTVEGWWKNRISWWNQDFSSAQKELMKKKWWAAQPKPPVEKEKEQKEKKMKSKKMDMEEESISLGGKQSLNDISESREMLRSEAPPSRSRMASAPAPSAPSPRGAPAPAPPSSAPSLSSSITGSNAKQAEAPAPEPTASITIKAWTPDTPYIREMKTKPTIEEQYKTYLSQREGYSGSPAFYLDCATFFFNLNTKEGKEFGELILTSIADTGLESPELFRIIGYKMSNVGMHKEAAFVFEKVLKLRNYEPQSHRDLALVYSDMEKYDKALNLLLKV